MTSSPKHTPAPWYFEGRHPFSDKWQIRRQDTVIIAEVERCPVEKYSRKTETGYIVHYDDSEQLANARLIAAAPELLDALKQLLLVDAPRSVRHKETQGYTDSVVAKALVAIAKAEGK